MFLKINHPENQENGKISFAATRLLICNSMQVVTSHSVIIVTLYNNVLSHIVIITEWTGTQVKGPTTLDLGPKTYD